MDKDLKITSATKEFILKLGVRVEVNTLNQETMNEFHMAKGQVAGVEVHPEGIWYNICFDSPVNGHRNVPFKLQELKVIQ